MSLFSVSSICFIVIIFSIFLGKLELWKKIPSFENTTIVAIGILSARENFIQRKAVRLTWLKDYSSNSTNSVKAWFVVGNSSCHIPPEYRLSYFSCEKWNLNASGLKEHFFTGKEIKSRPFPGKVYQGFSFKKFQKPCGSMNLQKRLEMSLYHDNNVATIIGDLSGRIQTAPSTKNNVNHPVTVTRLGVLFQALLPNTYSKVAIMDVQSKEIIVQAMFLSNMSSSAEGFMYSPVDKILLPKDYEGLIMFNGYMQPSINSTIAWNDGGGIITFKRVYSSPYHLDSKKFLSDLFPVVSIEFNVDEFDRLKEIIKKEEMVTKQWQMQLKEIQNQLDIEKTQHDDMLIVDTIDTYRKLPVKLLKFYKWLERNVMPLYVIKTDDDSIINIKALLKKIQEDQVFNSDKLWIWSRFRKDWPVNLIGKWADDDYTSSYYPSFPCGAAYVMSRRTFMWLSSNAETLHAYQGEDVSMGIWLSAINPDLIEDENFECDLNCKQKSYNRAQQNADQMHDVWSNFMKCQNLCDCH